MATPVCHLPRRIRELATPAQPGLNPVEPKLLGEGFDNAIILVGFGVLGLAAGAAYAVARPKEWKTGAYLAGGGVAVIVGANVALNAGWLDPPTPAQPSPYIPPPTSP